MEERQSVLKADLKRYMAAHYWIESNFGKPSSCESDECSEISQNYDWANLSSEYRHERSDWKRLCRSCHRLMDYGNVCRNGHPRTPENIYIPPKKPTTRSCRPCSNEAAKRFRDKRIETQNG